MPTSGPYLCPCRDFSSGQIAAQSEWLCCSDSNWARAWLVSEVDVNWHLHTPNPPACCLQNVSFSSRAEIETEMLWQITVSKLLQRQLMKLLGMIFLGKVDCLYTAVHSIMYIMYHIAVWCVIGCFNNVSSVTCRMITYILNLLTLAGESTFFQSKTLSFHIFLTTQSVNCTQDYTSDDTFFKVKA